MRKQTKWFIPLFFIGTLFVTTGCNKDDDGNSGGGPSTTAPTGVPVVTTAEVYNILETSAIGGGEVISEGDTVVMAKGICWGTGNLPNIEDDNSTYSGFGMGAFTSQIDGLEPNTAYNVRAYAINDIGVGYGEVVSFTTPESVGGTAPCDPDENAMTYNSTTLSYGYTLGMGDGTGGYLFMGSDFSTNSTLQVSFANPPAGGEYQIAEFSTTSSDLGPSECIVIGTLPSSDMFWAYSGQTVYVDNLGEGDYSITFCDINFETIDGEDFTSSGNLTN